MRSILSCLFLLFTFCPGIARGQHWRAEASVGITFMDVIGYDKGIPQKGPDLSKSPLFIPTSRSTPKPMAGLKIMRRDSAWEYGISAQMVTLKFGSKNSIDTLLHLSVPPVTAEQYTYLARPAVPLTAFFNYTHHLSKLYAFAGLNAGVVFASGRVSKDVSELLYYETYNIYFQSGMGYTVGGQLGFRRSYGQFDLGLELQANFIHLPLKQGNSGSRYDYDIIYFPVKGYIGYCF